MLDFEKRLQAIRNLERKCKYDEGLELIKDLKTFPEISREEFFVLQLELSRVLNFKAKFTDAIVNSLENYHASQIEGFSLLSLDFLVECAQAFYRLGNTEKSLEYISQGNAELEKLTNIHPKDLAKREAWLVYYFSSNMWQLGKYKKAISLIEETLQKQKQFENNEEAARLLMVKSVVTNAQGDMGHGLNILLEALEIAQDSKDISTLTMIYNNIGWIYERIGKFEEALEYIKRSAEIIKTTENRFLNCTILDNIGNIYRQMGDLDQSEQFLLQAINLGEKLGNNFKLTHYYFDIIRTLTEQKRWSEAQEYLTLFQKIVEREDSKAVKFRYKIAQAIMLKSSRRARDRYQAQSILLEIVQKKNSEYDYMVYAIMYLCDLLLTDLKTTNEQDIIGEISELIHQLQEIAEKFGSHSLYGEAYLLQAKLALLTLDFNESRKNLIKAQNIAEKNGLTQLAIHVSNEHDNLLQEETRVVELKRSNAGIEKRILYSGIQQQLSTMTREKGYSDSDSEEENPLQFLIMNETGATLYRYEFTPSFSIDGQLLSGFLSAMDSFSVEFFKEYFERAKFGENFLALARSPPFIICYIYNGNSYFALQKIKKFMQNFQDNTYQSKEILMQSYKTNCIVNEDDGIFINKLLHQSFQLQE